MMSLSRVILAWTCNLKPLYILKRKSALQTEAVGFDRSRHLEGSKGLTKYAIKVALWEMQNSAFFGTIHTYIYASD